MVPLTPPSQTTQGSQVGHLNLPIYPPPVDETTGGLILPNVPQVPVGNTGGLILPNVPQVPVDTTGGVPVPQTGFNLPMYPAGGIPPG